MRIARNLKIHKCNACAAPLDNSDFVSIGLHIRTRMQYFFDYHCPKCTHRGRYVLNLQTGIKVADALEILAAQIEEEEESSDSRIDWDSIKWD